MRAENANSPGRTPKSSTGVWLLAAGGGCLMVVAIAVTASLVTFLVLRRAPVVEPAREVVLPPIKLRPPNPAGQNPAFKAMVDRLAGRWEGVPPQGGSITYDYRADGSFSLQVQGPNQALMMNGTWQVVGIGADSLDIKRNSSDAPNEFFEPGDRPQILFPAPNLMRHARPQEGIDFARAGSGAKPGVLPPPNERQKAVAALRLAGASVQQDIGFGGIVREIAFPEKNATDDILALMKPLTDVTLVRLANCADVTDAGLAHLAGLTKLDARWN
jgi:hypothetical protein